MSAVSKAPFKDDFSPRKGVRGKRGRGQSPGKMTSGKTRERRGVSKGERERKRREPGEKAKGKGEVQKRKGKAGDRGEERTESQNQERREV